MTEKGSDLSLLRWFVRLRWVATMLQTAVVIGAIEVFRFEWTPIVGLAIAGLAVSNLLLPTLVVRSLSVPTAMGCALILDTIITSSVLAATGAVHNPFTVILLAYIALSATVLDGRWTWSITAVAIVSFRLLFLAVPPSHDHHVTEDAQIFASHLEGMWVAFSLSAALIAFFVTRISETLREREEQLRGLAAIEQREGQLVALTTLAAGAAHELSTPLGTIAVVAGELKRRALGGNPRSPTELGSDLVEDLTVISSEVQRCKAIIERMAGKIPGGVEEESRIVSVHELTKLLVERLDGRYPATVSVDENCADRLMHVPVTAVTKAVESLVKNGVDASPAGSEIRVVLDRELNSLRLSVVDRGCGIPDALQDRIGQPFFTTKEPGSGLGLGIFLVRLIAKRIGGSFTILSAERSGTTAVLRLPLVESA